MKKVMIADDSFFMRAKIKGVIERDGYQVIAEAANGAEAIHKYLLCMPDILLLDLTMPVVDGLTALKEIMKIEPNANIVIFSSLSTKYTTIEALRLGAKDFIIKPYFEQIIPVLKNL